MFRGQGYLAENLHYFCDFLDWQPKFLLLFTEPRWVFTEPRTSAQKLVHLITPCDHSPDSSSQCLVFFLKSFGLYFAIIMIINLWYTVTIRAQSALHAVFRIFVFCQSGDNTWPVTLTLCSWQYSSDAITRRHVITIIHLFCSWFTYIEKLSIISFNWNVCINDYMSNLSSCKKINIKR